MNVTSYLRHADYIETFDADIIALQEVRLTIDGQRIAGDNAWENGWNPIWGRPQPIRRGTRASVLDAKQGGVGFLSSSAHLSTHTPRTAVGDELFQSGRWMGITVRVHGTPGFVHVISFYGVSGANEGGDAMDSNEALIQQMIAESLSLGDSPVVICGDFNVLLQKSPALMAAVGAGHLIDAASAASAADGSPLQDTYHCGNCSSRIDMILLNPVAATMLLDFAVLPPDDDGIKNHYPIRVSLDVPTERTHALSTQRICRLPSPKIHLSQTELDNLADDVLDEWQIPFYEACEVGDIEAMWDIWSRMAEAFLLERGARESGEHYILANKAYRGRGFGARVSWRQVQSAARTADGIPIDEQRAALVKCVRFLREIVATPCQSKWRRIQSIGRSCMPAEYQPYFDESVEFTPMLADTLLHAAVSYLDAIVAGSRTRLIRRWRSARNKEVAARPDAVFKEFRAVAQPPLTVLRDGTGRLTGNPATMDSILHETWLPIFAKHDCDNPPPSVAQFMQRYGQRIRTHTQHAKRLTLDDLQAACARMSSSGAGGLDGWLPEEIKSIPPEILQLLLPFYDAIEATGVWPAALCWAGITLIPKEHSGDPMDLRPISVMPVIYRLWASARMRCCLPWQEKWIHASQHGSRARHGVSDALASLMLQFESADVYNLNLIGVTVDYAKAFDSIPIDITFAIMERLGMDPHIMSPLRGMYAALGRRFKLNGFVGEAFYSTNGILQGCPLSVLLLNALFSVLSAAIDEHVDTESFVDDITMVAVQPQAMQRALDELSIFNELTAQAVNVKKTKAFGFQGAGELYYRGAALSHAPKVKVLGVELEVVQNQLNARIPDERIAVATALLHRIRFSGLPYAFRARLVTGLVVPKALYGIAFAELSVRQERQLRSAIVQCLWKTVGRARNPGLLLTLGVAGHLADPIQVSLVQRMTTFHRIMQNQPHLQAQTWRVIRQRLPRRRYRRGGFLEPLLAGAKRHNIKVCFHTKSFLFPDEPGMLRRLGCRTAGSTWAHCARHAARLRVWRQVDKERQRNMEPFGIGAGINRDATLQHYNSTNYRQRHILRRIFTGGVWSQTRRSHMPSNDGNRLCVHCEAATEETLHHMWWECTAWDNERKRLFPDGVPDVSDWPIAMRECGVVPAQGPACVIRDVQRMAIRIYSRRFRVPATDAGT